VPKTFTDDEAVYMTQSVTHHDCWTCELRSDKNSYRRVTTMQCRSHSRRRTSECLFVTACSMDEYAKDKRTENNLTVRSGISEAETTNNKRLRSTFCIEAIRTQSIARPLCDSRASCSWNSSTRIILILLKLVKSFFFVWVTYCPTGKTCGEIWQ